MVATTAATRAAITTSITPSPSMPGDGNEIRQEPHGQLEREQDGGGQACQGDRQLQPGRAQPGEQRQRAAPHPEQRQVSGAHVLRRGQREQQAPEQHGPGQGGADLRLRAPGGAAPRRRQSAWTPMAPAAAGAPKASITRPGALNQPMGGPAPATPAPRPPWPPAGRPARRAASSRGADGVPQGHQPAADGPGDHAPAASTSASKSRPRALVVEYAAMARPRTS